ncbi:MAG: hypothetical protein LBP40_02630 [Campylobacteraceae bacterium]|nr:hypothetical protein [Campylobacteraceae bacterium]
MCGSTKKQNVILSEKEFIGKGQDRKCYIHPKNSSLCIKMLIERESLAKKQFSREIKYNEKLKKQNIPILPKYYGKVSTNMGDGYLFEFIKDEIEEEWGGGDLKE